MIEDYTIISPTNKVGNSLKYTQNFKLSGVGNPYPVFYRVGVPIYEGDRLIVIGKTKIEAVTIEFRDRTFVNRDPEYIKRFTNHTLGWR